MSSQQQKKIIVHRTVKLDLDFMYGLTEWHRLSDEKQKDIGIEIQNFIENLINYHFDDLEFLRLQKKFSLPSRIELTGVASDDTKHFVRN